MSSDYDFKYRLRVGFNEPGDVFRIVDIFNKYSKKYEENDFHPAIVQVGNDDYLCLVETDGLIFNKDDFVELHSCGCDGDIDILGDLIKDIKMNAPGIVINGFITIIIDARDVEFIFFKNSAQIDSLSDDDIAEMYEKELRILGTEE